MTRSRQSNRPLNPETRSEREADCRKILGKLNHGASVWEFSVSRDVLETLEYLELVHTTASQLGEMLYEATASASAYCADPSTFEL